MPEQVKNNQVVLSKEEDHNQDQEIVLDNKAENEGGDKQLVLDKKEKDNECSEIAEGNKFGVVESSNKKVVLDKVEEAKDMGKKYDDKRAILENEELNFREFEEETEILKKEHPEAFRQLEEIAIANGFKKLLLLSEDKTHDWSIIDTVLNSKTADIYSESQLIAHEKLMKDYDSDFAQKAADAETKYCVKRREGEAHQSVKIANKKMRDLDKEEFLNLSSAEQLESLKKSVGHFGSIEAQKDIIALNKSFKKEDTEKFIIDHAIRKVYADFLNDGEESLNKESQYGLEAFIKPEIIEKIKIEEKKIKDKLLKTQQKERKTSLGLYDVSEVDGGFEVILPGLLDKKREALVGTTTVFFKTREDTERYASQAKMEQKETFEQMSLEKSYTNFYRIDRQNDKFRVTLPGLVDSKTGYYVGTTYKDFNSWQEAKDYFLQERENEEKLTTKPLLEIQTDKNEKVAFSDFDAFRPIVAPAKESYKIPPSIEKYLLNEKKLRGLVLARKLIKRQLKKLVGRKNCILLLILILKKRGWKL